MSNINSTWHNWIDWCKSITILLVVWGHMPMPTLVNSIIYSFHMPLFFLISGYLYSPQQTIKGELKKGFKTLLIPYLIYQLIFYPYWLIREYLVYHQSFTINHSVIDPIVQSLLSDPINGPAWFIYCLFFIKIYTYFIQKKPSLSNLLTTVSCILSIIICLWWNKQAFFGTYVIHNFFAMQIFFFAGIALKHIDLKRISNSLNRSFIWLLLSTLIFIILTPSDFIKIYTTPLEVFKYYILGFTGSAMILGLGFILNKIKFKVVYNISIGTMVILGMHWMFIGVINFSIEKYTHLSDDIIYSSTTAFFISIFIVTMIYPIIIFCEKYLPILLGKSSSLKLND